VELSFAPNLCICRGTNTFDRFGTVPFGHNNVPIVIGVKSKSVTLLVPQSGNCQRTNSGTIQATGQQIELRLIYVSAGAEMDRMKPGEPRDTVEQK
jgi:hypothetical protein